MKKNFKKVADAQGILTKKVTSNDGVNALIDSLGIIGFVKTAVKNACFCGRVFDPRCSTNVIVPAWAKSLMDKEKSLAGSVASILQSTINAICLVYYKNAIANNGQIQTHQIFAVPYNGRDILHGIYTINVIEHEDPTNEVGTVKQIQVKV